MYTTTCGWDRTKNAADRRQWSSWREKSATQWRWSLVPGLFNRRRHTSGGILYTHTHTHTHKPQSYTHTHTHTDDEVRGLIFYHWALNDEGKFWCRLTIVLVVVEQFRGERVCEYNIMYLVTCVFGRRLLPVTSVIRRPWKTPGVWG